MCCHFFLEVVPRLMNGLFLRCRLSLHSAHLVMLIYYDSVSKDDEDE